jgi:putative FmdB family regulatory protein
MPMYTYTCPNCGATKTLLRKVAERDDPTRCDNAWCHDAHAAVPTMTRDIAGPAFSLKGNGWARDGYGG